MVKIATHNSATGEAGSGFLSLLVAPFSKCQSKTLEEQYEAGCRYFDIRYKYSTKRGCYVCAHGLWESEKTLRDVLTEINDFCGCYVMLTCESGAPLTRHSIRHIISECQGIQFTSFNRKHPRWRMDYCEQPTPHTNAYKLLDWSSWHTLLPIPWLWAKLGDAPTFNNKTFTFIDFL